MPFNAARGSVRDEEAGILKVNKDFRLFVCGQTPANIFDLRKARIRKIDFFVCTENDRFRKLQGSRMI